MGSIFLEENVGGADLFVRALTGTISITALAMDTVQPPWHWVVAFLALEGFFTAITRHCTLYAITGFSTARKYSAKFFKIN